MAQGLGPVGIAVSFGRIWLPAVVSDFADPKIICERYPLFLRLVAPVAALRFAA